MYYIYFPYVAVIAGLVYFECREKKYPVWWAAMVLFAPITTPYYMFKVRKRPDNRQFLVFLTTFTVVCLIEIFMYSKYMEKNKYNNLPPVARQIIQLSEQVKITTAKLDSSLSKLNSLSKVDSRIKKIKSTMEFIQSLTPIMEENNAAINRLITFSAENRTMFKDKELDWVFLLQDYYNNRNVRLHLNSLKQYLVEFGALLEYTYINLYSIRDHKIEKHLKNYDEYYLRYRRAVDTHNRFNMKRIQFQNKFLVTHPDLKPYLPDDRQTEAFKLWE